MSRDNGDRKETSADPSTLSEPGSLNARAGGRADRGEGLLAGELIDDRFRIVGRLGSGGMGVVYRADDLELGSSVALKFLPAALVVDPERLERLRSEVRIARRVAHPNVCRVYDIGEADGRPFLSMEYIDGEDLASLLRRIGRLPKDKAVELSREICAGVAAAHDLGVVHRDLKPANVMIDGRGRARVADFGLASARDDETRGDARDGTPIYMAPEQLAGAQATEKTDIYALGLVLYELFTGQRARDSAAVDAARRSESSSHPPTNPSELVDGMDPQVERVIMRCLETDPEDRPASALAVMAALPGGDPLAAVLKAGNTPSPELVAASGRIGSLPLTRAMQLGVLAIACFGIAIWIFASPTLGEKVGGILAPEVLEHQSLQLLEDLGYPVARADTAWGIQLQYSLKSALEAAPLAQRKELIRSRANPVLQYWFRSSPEPMSPWRGSLPGTNAGNIVTVSDPPLDLPGMALVRLSPDGRLIELRVAPHPLAAPSGDKAEEILETLINAGGLAGWIVRPESWDLASPMPGTSTTAWKLSDPEDQQPPWRLVFTLASGKPTWARIDRPSTSLAPATPTRDFDGVRIVFFVFFALGAVVAFFNIRSARWDRRGALRLAMAAFVLCFLAELVGAHHTLDPTQEVRGFFTAVAYAATRGLMTWLLYVAMEPFIRKLRPKSMISWSRLLNGRLTDPAVGRDLLVGLVVVALETAAIGLWGWTRDLQEVVLPFWAFTGGQNPMDVTFVVTNILRQAVVAIGSALGFLLIYVILRWLFRRFRPAATVLLWTAFFGFSLVAHSTGLQLLDELVVAAIAATGACYLVVRHGLLAFATLIYVYYVTIFTIFTLDPSDWYFAPTAIVVLFIIALTVFGVKVCGVRDPARVRVNSMAASE